MWPTQVKQFIAKLNIQYPIIQAPMAGFTSAKLVAAVSNAGALGSLGAALLTPDQIKKTIQEIRSLTPKAFGVNLFAPSDPTLPNPSQIEMMNKVLDPYRKELGIPLSPEVQFAKSMFEEQLAVILEEKPAVFSFTFNILSADRIKKLKTAKILVLGTATTLTEALTLAENGVDAIVAQSYEAGGHRGTPLTIPVEDALIGGMALIPQLKKSLQIPIIASGGIMNGQGILAAIILGAYAVQMGTAFLTCDEATIHAAHKTALLNGKADNTHLTRAFTGRFARAIKNRFSLEMKSHQKDFLAFPFQSKLTADIKTKAAEINNADFLAMWAGQNASLCESKSAASLIRSWISEMEEILTEWD